MDNSLDTIEQSFDLLPGEIKSYIYSPLFHNLFETITHSESLSQKAIIQFKTVLYRYIAQVSTEEELLQTIQRITETPHQNQKIIDWIKKNVTEKITSLVMDAYVQNETNDNENKDDNVAEEKKELVEERSKEAVAPSETIKTLSPLQAIQNIQSRLTKPSPANSSVVRDYSNEQVSGGVDLPIPQRPGNTLHDIYREVPEK